jgi:o-succinylbenzoate synthase
MQTHLAHYLRLHHTDRPLKQGWGEAAPLPGLSLDYAPDFQNMVEEVCQRFNALQLEPGDQETHDQFLAQLHPWPSLRFAFETAWLDLNRGGQQELFPSAFSRGEKGIKINGLIWMGDLAFMREQIEKKLHQGFTCLKMKIGGLDFSQEMKILEEIRAVASPQELELRLDANGAFLPSQALEKLDQLARFTIHSIEQPIKQNRWQEMATLCQASPIAIALDEELIRVATKQEKQQMLASLQPRYIILKPTLVGGLKETREWIQVAEGLGMAWWLTSALESNIGLNAIAQFSQEFQNPLPQGLGTGQLYHNNIASGLEIKGEELWYNPEVEWDLPA